MRRRAFLIGLTLGWPLSAAAQDASRIPHIGFLGNSTPKLEANLIQPFREGLRDLGYMEGRNIVVEYRWAEGHYERFPMLVAELVAAKVRMIVTAGTPSALAIRKAAPEMPIVMVAVGDPVGNGLAVSLARPGSNATGLTSISPDLEGKRLEIIKEALPSVSRIAVLLNPSNAYQVRDEKEIQAAASALDVFAQSYWVSRADELDSALERIRDNAPGVLFVPADRLFLHNRERITDFSLRNRIPLVSAYRELAEAGGLMSFGPNYAVMHRQAARYVDKILKGAKPADLPIEQPERFEFVINLKSAQALGVQLPPTLLTRADEVIE